MPFTDEDVIARLDMDTVQEFATITAHELRARGHAALKLAPNDGTEYRFIIVAPTDWIARQSHPMKDYQVALINCDGAGYAWNGGHVDSGYAAEKWTQRGHQWTAVVVATFLSALSDAIKAQS